VSNRVAVPEKNAAQRAGGLEVAVNAAFKHRPGIWFGWSGKVTTNTKIATQNVVHDQVTYTTLDLSKEDHKEYYNGFANRVLWPILHYRVDLAEFSRRDLSGYLRVNNHFARELHDRGHGVGREVSVPILYKGEEVTRQRLDMIVDGKLIIEIKSTRILHEGSVRQVANYLRATNLELGLLLHFGPRPRFYRVICTNSTLRTPNKSSPRFPLPPRSPRTPSVVVASGNENEPST
jgi:GxxExxY protein